MLKMLSRLSISPSQAVACRCRGSECVMLLVILSQALYNSICKESPDLIQCEAKRGSHWASRVAHYSWSIWMDVV
jgi:hypothetical protein